MGGQWGIRLAPRFGWQVMAAMLLGWGGDAAMGHVNSGANCASCHSTARNGMNLVGFQSLTNLGAGNRAFFQVVRGERLSVGIQVTDGHNEYGLALVNPAGTGVRNPANKLVFTPDSSWTKRSGYSSVGPSSANRQWSHAIAVPGTTAPDFYLFQLRMAGTGGGRWSQEIAFYVQVLAPAPSAPAVTEPVWREGVFSCRVTTTSGFTYRLEVQRDGPGAPWQTAAERAGDGGVVTLSDTAASGRHAVYRVRVE